MIEAIELTDLRSGDARSWRLVHERVCRAAASFRSALAEEWEDAVQEAEIKLLRALREQNFDDSIGLDAFAWRVTRNVCVDQLRRRKVRSTRPLDEVAEPLAPHGASPAVAVERGERGIQVARLLAVLPQEGRELLWALEQGQTYSELASRMGVSPGALRVRVHRYRRQAAARFERMTTPIVGTAQRLFLQRGYVQTPISLIAEKSGVTVAEIEDLFGDKTGILGAIFEGVASGVQGIAPGGGGVRRFLQTVDDPHERIDRALRVTASGYARGLADIDRIIAEASQADRCCRPLIARVRSAEQSMARLLIVTVRECLGPGQDDEVDSLIPASIEIDGPATYRWLRGELGWSSEDIHEWKMRKMAALILA